MDITKLSIEELKALAYDQQRLIAVSQRNVQAIELELSKREQEEKPEVKKK